MRSPILATTALLAGLLLAPASPSLAANAKNALGALAVSPDGATIVAGGDSRALYLIDPADLAVRERVYLGTNPLEMAFSADGATLAVWTADDLVLLLSTESWEEVGRVEDVAYMSHAAAVDSLVVLGRSKRKSGVYTTPLQVVSLESGEVVVAATVAADAAGLASRPDASAFVVLAKGEKNEAEAKESPPGDMKGFEKEIFKQQHDERSGEVILLDAAGVEVGRTPTWFSAPANMTGAWIGEEVQFIGLHNKNLAVDGSGATLRMFQTPVDYNYGIALSPDQATAAFGDGRRGAVVSLADGGNVIFDLAPVPGPPEYVLGYAFAPDGSIFAGTSAYRLLHIGPDGTVRAMAPIF